MMRDTSVPSNSKCGVKPLQFNPRFGHGELPTRVAIGHLDMPLALERREHHEQIGRAIALILIIVTFWLPWFAAPQCRLLFVARHKLTNVPPETGKGLCRPRRHGIGVKQNRLHSGDRRP
jgi:hypothetical protein